MLIFRSRTSFDSVLLMAVLAGLIAGCSGSGERGAGEEATPSMWVIAVGQPGSVLNAVGTGIAKLTSEATDTTMRVRVTSGMDALVGAGDAEFGVSASDSTHLSSHGLRHYQGRPQRNLRLALPGPPLILGFLVSADSSFQSVADLKGVAVPGEYPNARPMYHDGNAMLSTVGLTWEDLEVLPVASFRDGVQAFIEGRSEAVVSSVGSGLTQQADANLGGVRFLTLPEGEETSRRMWEEEPGFHALSVPAGFSLGIDRDLVLAAKDVYLTTNAETSEEAVYQLVSLLWDRIGELDRVHPIFGRWSREAMSNSRVTIPFHPGTLRFLREQGAWSEEHAATQERLLADLAEPTS